MPEPTNPSPAWLIPAILVGFPLVFIPMWCGVCFLLSQIGGWARLAPRFADPSTPRGTAFSGQSGRVGVANYNKVLTIHTSSEGLHLAAMKLFRVGHPPLLIPWSEIRGAQRSQRLWMDNVVFEVGPPSLAKVRLPARIFEGQPVAVAG